ncbi:MAG: hypothetical protein R3B97_09830 [Dehalococcoidia bacterium]|nr:hypothetical protein [Dehalococcoidia bacterium]MCA9830642.1 hypothetical protein [Dehalococcoidia bacterium]MCB9484827.1 hypothetical protein [Thermoflexaceae bacterium]
MAATNGSGASNGGHVPDADTALLERAAVRRLHAREFTVERSLVGVMRAERATLTESNAAVVIARSLACDEVHAGILVSPVVRGEVHTWLDMRSAIAIGLGMALGRGLIAGARGLGRRSQD